MPRKTHDDYARQFAALGYSFRMNEMDDSVEVNGERINDGIVSEIESNMSDSGYAVSNCRRAWTYEAYKARYHPIRDYFNGLQWNGEDVFGELMACFKFHNKSFAEVAIWRFMLGTVARVMQSAQNFMLVLDGGQGIGKSHFSRWLCPISKLFVEGTLNPDSNDTKLRIIANLIWEVGELQYTTRKSDVEALKNIITQQEITARPPYFRYDITKPVTCSFIGTINENGAGFLNDPTGSRRFAVVKIASIDWARYNRIDRDQLWAQIAASYKAGEGWSFTPEEQELQYAINESYTLISSTHEILLNFYEIDPDKYPNVWLPAANILLTLFEKGMNGSQRQAQMEIAGIMEKLGIEKSDKHATTGNGRLMCYRGVMPKT
jgi:predicted P-loop ATPase